MDDHEMTQLSFNVGGSAPNLASLKISGGMGLPHELRKGDPTMLVISGPDGEVLAQADGVVTTVAFKDKRNKFGEVESTERAHTVRLG
jgi:hypothetical protein